MPTYHHIEYICTWCGAKAIRGINAGRPMPGNCPRKESGKDGRKKPHTWRINRRLPGREGSMEGFGEELIWGGRKFELPWV